MADILDLTLPHRWIGRATDHNTAIMYWPPKSPDLTPCDFHLCGYTKDKVYVPPLADNLDALKQRIIAADASIDEDMLSRIWQEIDYRMVICRVTNGSHIEHL